MTKKPIVGPTGKFPQGKLERGDEGELNIAMFIFKGQVRIEFGKPIAWLAMPPHVAKDFAERILEHAAKIINVEKK